jgi:hypothetical protein
METDNKITVLEAEAAGIPQINNPDEHFKFSFITQPAPVERPERNDYYFPKKYDIKKNHFEITVKPENTPYWRFGFRYSKTGEFPPLTEARHVDSNIVDIHICVGDMKSKGRWHHENRVYLQSYNVAHNPNPQLIEAAYKGEEITMIVKWNEKTSKMYYELKANGRILCKNEFDLGSYSTCIFGAWSDFNDYNLSADIKVTSQPAAN